MVLEFGETDFQAFLKNMKHLNPHAISYFWMEMVNAVNVMHNEGEK